MADTLERVTKIIVDRLGVDEADVKLEASFKEDLGADSLDVVELVMELEDEFDMEISDEDAEKIATVGDAVNYIQTSNKLMLKVPPKRGALALYSCSYYSMPLYARCIRFSQRSAVNLMCLWRLLCQNTHIIKIKKVL